MQKIAWALTQSFYLTLIMTSIVLILLFLLFYKQKLAHQKLAKLYAENEDHLSKMHEQKKMFDVMFQNASNGTAILNLDGSLVRVNGAFSDLLGYSATEMLSTNFYHLIHPNDLSALQTYIQELLEGKLKVYQSEQQCFHKSGNSVWISSSITVIRDDQNKAKYFLIQAQNITLQKEAEEKLRHMAYHDPLTGLANRNKLQQFITHILASARRQQQSFALLFLDLDRFKNINDTIGHEAGDEILKIIAERLHNAVRSTDMVARLGGDEFVLLITDVKKTVAVAYIAQKILESMLEVIVIKSQEIYITTSIGISIYPYDGQNIETLMKNADLALYRAKEQGRNNYQFYTVEMTSRAIEKMSLQNALAHALVKNEFLLNYQPKMEIKTRKITGTEALLRWKSNEYGTTSPDEIVSLADETGLIIPVSQWILETACKQLKDWHSQGFLGLTMAVNCSGRQFKQTTFVDEVATIIAENGLQPRDLEIEVTEALIMQDPENTLRVLYALKDLGVQIAIDDFGTGYWSLNNLRRLSVDKIKIDKTFIKQVTHDETSAAITRAIIAMANKLQIRSIAEGVETKEQYQFLAEEGCTEIQGYYLTQPLFSDAMTKFLRHPIPDAEVIKNETSF